MNRFEQDRQLLTKLLTEEHKKHPSHGYHMLAKAVFESKQALSHGGNFVLTVCTNYRKYIMTIRLVSKRLNLLKKRKILAIIPNSYKMRLFYLFSEYGNQEVVP